MTRASSGATFSCGMRSCSEHPDAVRLLHEALDVVARELAADAVEGDGRERPAGALDRVARQAAVAAHERAELALRRVGGPRGVVRRARGRHLPRAQAEERDRERRALVLAEPERRHPRALEHRVGRAHLRVDPVRQRRPDPAGHERRGLEHAVADRRRASARCARASGSPRGRGTSSSRASRTRAGPRRRASRPGARRSPSKSFGGSENSDARYAATSRASSAEKRKRGISVFGCSRCGSRIQAVEPVARGLRAHVRRAPARACRRGRSTAWHVTQRERRKISPPFSASAFDQSAVSSVARCGWPSRNADSASTSWSESRNSPIRVFA